MTDRRRGTRFLVCSAAPGQAQLLHDVMVECVAAGVATVLAPAPARVDEQLLLQVSNADGSVTTWEGRVRSSAPVRRGDLFSHRIELQLTENTQIPATPSEGIA